MNGTDSWLRQAWMLQAYPQPGTIDVVLPIGPVPVVVPAVSYPCSLPRPHKETYNNIVYSTACNASRTTPVESSSSGRKCSLQFMVGCPRELSVNVTVNSLSSLLFEFLLPSSLVALIKKSYPIEFLPWVVGF